MFPHLIVFVFDLVFVYQGFKYVGVAGKQISQGMEVPMMYMYGIMPLCGVICALCIVAKLVMAVRAPLSAFEPKDKPLGD